MRNSWSREELIIALDVYFRNGRKLLDDTHPEIIKTSQVIKELHLNRIFSDRPNFRSPGAVSMKLCNFGSIDPMHKGAGLPNGGKLDQIVWDEFSQQPEYLHDIAESIFYLKENYDTMPRRHVSVERDADCINFNALDVDDKQFPEGKIIEKRHKAYERNTEAVKKVKILAMQQGKLYCVVCGFDFNKVYGDLGLGFIECHHIVPLSEYNRERQTRVSDLVLVCSNCHRMLHRKRPWLPLEDFSTILASNRMVEHINR